MSDASNLRFLQYGTHASTSDWTAMPGSLTFLEPESDVVLDSRPRHYERGSVQRGNGQRVPRTTIGMATDGIPDITLALRGLSGSGVADTVSTSTLTHDLDGILSALFGVKTEGVGDVLSGTPGTGTTIAGADTVTAATGSGIVFTGDTSGKLIARQISQPSGSNFVIDRDLTDDTGAADNPEASLLCSGMRTYSLSAITPNRTHFAFDAEGDNFRNRFVGCMSSASISFAPGEYARLTLSGIRFTDCDADDESALTNPTWATPTRGKLIEVIDCPMWIGATQYIAMGLEVDLGLTIAPRGMNGPNGPHGFVVSAVNPTLRWTMMAGTLTAPAEVTDTILATLRNDTAKDCAWQFGRELGGICYVRAGALDIVCERGTQDGLEVINCIGTPTDASELATVGLDHCLSLSIG